MNNSREYINNLFGAKYTEIRNISLTCKRGGIEHPDFSLHIDACSESGALCTDYRMITREEFLRIRGFIYNGAFLQATITLVEYGRRFQKYGDALMSSSRTMSWHFEEELPF